MRYLKQNIKHLRTNKGLTQPQLGEILNVSRDNIASYERGTVPPVEIIHKILDYFHISFNDLLENDLSKVDANTVSDLDREAIKKTDLSNKVERLKMEINHKNKSLEALQEIIDTQKNTIKSQQETIEALKLLVEKK